MSDWIEWNGGEIPIEEDQPVFVRLRDGSESVAAHPAGDMEWNCAYSDAAPHLNDRHTKFDIVAYKLA